ncbi:MAG: hypothetical protein ABI592_02940 [Acidobacteriota bacterium]
MRAQRPSAGWRTIETPHFRVHFPAPFEAWAGRAASALEGVHARVADYIGYSPARRIDVLVSDPEADSNGLAYPYLDRPFIELWATPPDPDSGLGDFRDWTELLATHEVAHILHLTRPRNRPGWLARLVPLPVGPVFLNSPRWLAEGYATLVEGALTGSGRPASSYRASVLRRFAIEGKLPSYGALNGTGGWLGGSMAYLVGSSYLEWLEAREGSGSLRNLWKRMASRRGGDFEKAFRAIFGRRPEDLYDRFRADLTARALDQEKALTAAGLAAGETWQRLEGGTASPQVSADGSRLLARRSPRRGEAFLAVWTLEPSAAERDATAKRAERERALAEDPNEVPDKRESPDPRSPRWTLPRWNGQAPEDPRWMPDGRRVLFTRRSPGADGVLHRDLFLWEPDSGRVSRVTRLADVSDADPSPDGSWAIAVRGRHGRTELVRVELHTGESIPLAPSGGTGDPWEVWSHPRLSPDGRTVAVLVHREGVWRLRLVDAGGGRAASELPAPGGASVFGAPAWSRDGSAIFAATDATGVWELARFDASGSAVRVLTRVTGGAFSPAPVPGDAAVFFLELTAKGVDVRRLALTEGSEPDLGGGPRLPAVLAPPSSESRPAVFSVVSPSRPYRAMDTHVVRIYSSFTAGPDGASYLAGAQGTDLLGRLGWFAAGATGNAAGPRGATAALSWSGWPVEIRVQASSAIERPGAQRLVARPELDSERRGGALSASWASIFPAGSIRAEAWGGAERIEELATGRRFGRSSGGLRLDGSWRRIRGKSGLGLRASVAEEAGRTDGASWDRVDGMLRVTGWTSAATVSLSGRTGSSGGAPTVFDRFAVGGAASALLPRSFDSRSIESPALSAAAQLGERFEGGRLEASPASAPFLFYVERWRAWDRGAPRPDLLRLEGVELRIDRLIPLELPAALSAYVGAARVRSTAPRFDSIRGYAGLIYRP